MDNLFLQTDRLIETYHSQYFSDIFFCRQSLGKLDLGTKSQWHVPLKEILRLLYVKHLGPGKSMPKNLVNLLLPIPLSSLDSKQQRCAYVEKKCTVLLDSVDSLLHCNLIFKVSLAYLHNLHFPCNDLSNCQRCQPPESSFTV